MLVLRARGAIGTQHVGLHKAVSAFRIRVDVFFGIEDIIRAVLFQQLRGSGRLECRFGSNGGGKVVQRNITELLVHDIGYGIFQPKAGQHERRASCDSDDRHQKALFIAENITSCDLPGKRQALPERLQMLQ